ncbi:MAG: hypothetical protein WAO76_09310 [Georgfuchsia sp.]
MRIAVVHQLTGKKVWGDKSERPVIKIRYSHFVPFAAGQLSPLRPFRQTQFLRNGIYEAAVGDLTLPARCGHSRQKKSI